MKNISVIVPVYNVEKYIAECLDSILAQNVKDIEVICVNDGSTDDSLKILEEYQVKDKRIVVVSQDNRGLAEARNSGLEVAQGDYVCFVDSDDKLAPNSLGLLYETALKEEVDIVSYEAIPQYDFDVKEAKKNIDRYYIKSQDYTGKRTGREQFVLFMENDDYCDSACLLFIKRKWLEDNELRFYSGIYFEDALFVLNCHLYANRIYHVAKQLYIYRIRDNSIMQSNSSMDKVYSCVFNFEKMLEIVFREQSSDEMFCEMLVKYMRLVVMNMHIMEANREGKDDFSRFNYTEKFLYDTFFIGGVLHPEARIIKQGLIKNVEESAGVYLYGAGKVGELVCEFLSNCGLGNKIKAFVVSSKSGVQSEKNGIPIIEYTEIDIDDELVIVSMGRQLQQEVIPKLQRKGITNILCIDRNVQMILEREHGKTV